MGWVKWGWNRRQGQKRAKKQKQRQQLTRPSFALGPMIAASAPPLELLALIGASDHTLLTYGDQPSQPPVCPVDTTPVNAASFGYDLQSSQTLGLPTLITPIDPGFQTASGKDLPGSPSFSATQPPGIPLTQADQGGNDLVNKTRIERSDTQDLIDQVSVVDPQDVYVTNSHDLQGASFSVLYGQLRVSYLTPSGQSLGSQTFGRGNYVIQLPSNAPDEVVIAISSDGSEPATYKLDGFQSKASEPFNIRLEFNNSFTDSQRQTLERAAQDIASLIQEGLPTAIVDGKLIDDLNIKVSISNIDGGLGTQARSKIDFMRYGTGLPAQSLVQFDAADLDQLERSGQLFDVARHEFLHALGLGTLWEAKGLVDYAGTPLARYNGQNAVQAFKDLGGSTNEIPLETEGSGSAGLHWNENLFKSELMTSDVNSDLNNNTEKQASISTVTIASLADLGYQVNLNRATPSFGLFSGEPFYPQDLTPEDQAALEQLAASSAVGLSDDNIPPVMPEVSLDQTGPETWANAEKFWKNGEYYDWVPYRIVRGDTLSGIAYRTLGHGTYDYYKWIGDHNGIPNYDYIVTRDWIEVPQWHPNYEQEQEQERLKREAELKAQQEAEAKARQEAEAKAQQEAEQRRLEEEARQREAEAHQKELEEQQRQLEEAERQRRQQQEYEEEQARLRELARLAEIARQQGKGGLDWYLATPLTFGNTDPFEMKLGDVVGNLVPDDYYRFTLSRTGRLTAELKKLLADADLVLYDARNKPIAYSMRDGITDEQIIADLIPGTYMLRVNSPKGVTTDYELIVRFQQLLSATQKGPPPGWKVGGSNNGSGANSGSSGGPTFSDPRIEKIFKQAIADFAAPERQKAKSQVDVLKSERDRLEQEKRNLIASKSNELRSKVYEMLDNAKRDPQRGVGDLATSVKNEVSSISEGVIGRVDGLIPGWAGWAKDGIKQAINGAKSWLNAKADEVKNSIRDSIDWYVERAKSAYFTAGEANLAVEDFARQLKSKIEDAIGVLNGLVGYFKGKILAVLEFTKNIGAFNWNLYDNVVVGLVNDLTSSIQNTVRNTGRFFMDRVGDIESAVQRAISNIGQLLGDETGKIYNEYQDKIRSLNQQIDSITNETDNRIRLKEKQVESICQQIEAVLTDPDERNIVLGALLVHHYTSIEEAYDFVVKKRDELRQKVAEAKAQREAEEKARREAEAAQEKKQKEAEEKARQNIAQMSYADKLMAAAKLAIEQLPGDVQKALSDPTLWAAMAVVLAALAALHGVGVGELIDVALIWVFGFKAAWDLGAFFVKAAAAQDQQGLQDTANSFKEFVGDVGPIAVGKAFELIRGVLPVTNETLKFQKLLDLVSGDKARLGKLLSLVGNDATKLENLLSLVGNDATKLENLLSLVGNDATKLENLSRSVGDDKITLLLDLQKIEINGKPIKFTAENVIRIDRTSDGRIVFLEQGNSNAGLQHIKEAHATDFINKGITEEQIPDAVMVAVTKGKVVGYQGPDLGRPIYQLEFNGITQYIAVTVADNGFVVGANPTSFP
jgi:hypothetical protein